MCGICGIFNIKGNAIDRDIVVGMNSTLAHRGPDDEGYHVKGPIGMGHRRLSIIDLHSGHQPIYSEDRRTVIVFNGEIYNYKPIRDELIQKGHQFKTKTDTEVILHGYEEWGEACVDRLRGMFAFAVWNDRDQTLFLARDRLGIKPLYYAFDGSNFIFASELKAILASKLVTRDLDFQAVSDFISLGYVPAPKSIFKQIRKLPSAHHCTQTLSRRKIKRYWDLEFAPDPELSEQQWCESILEKLEESVKIRLMSDVPLGAFLSGGVDSSMVVALMAKTSRLPVITNTIGFSLQAYNEVDYARETARLFHTDQNEHIVTPDILETVDKLSWYYDEPFADSSSIPTYFVSKMARERVTVALSGDGGDENFAGYRRYFFDQFENRIRGVIPGPLRQTVVRQLADIYPKADRLPQFLRAKTLLTNLSKDPVEGYFNSMSQVLPAIKSRLFTRELADTLGGYDASSVFRTHYDQCQSDDPLSKIQYIDFNTYLPEDILTKVDRASMANSLEVRVPILDHEFVEQVAKIPSGLKIKGRTSKYILKEAAKHLLPKQILNRKKMGFCLPVGEWLTTELKPLVNETILSKPFMERGFFNQDMVTQMWDQHVKGERNNFQPLWTLLSFELWARKHL